MCTLGLITLMSEPLPLLEEKWLSTERGEVALDDESGVFFLEEQWHLVGLVVSLVGLVVVRHALRQ